MPHRPSHCILITVNPDNSGSARQFDTYSEGVAAFEASVAGGGTAYLYPSARKSLSSLDLGADVPAYNNGATYGTGALVRLNNKVYRLINFIGAGGYGPITHPSLWTEEVFLPQPNAPISSTGQTANGQKGFVFTNTQNNSNAVAPTITGYEGFEDFLTIASFSALYRTRVRAQYSDGSVGQWSSWNYVAYGTFFGSDAEYNYYSNGADSYYSEPKNPAYGTLINVVETPLVVNIDGVQDATLGTNRVYHYADGAGSEYTESEVVYIESGTFLFNAGGYTYRSDGEGSWTKTAIEYPPSGDFAYSETGGDHTVTINGGTYKVGEYGTNYLHDGAGGFTLQAWDTYYPYGTLIVNEGGNNYYSDENGYYYSEGDGSGGGGNGNAPYGTELSSDSGSSTLDWSAPDGQTGTWTYSTWSSTTYADGEGGTYTSGGGTNATSGDLIHSGSYTYENGTDEDGNPAFSAGTFYVRFDGMSGYYTDYN